MNNKRGNKGLIILLIILAITIFILVSYILYMGSKDSVASNMSQSQESIESVEESKEEDVKDYKNVLVALAKSETINQSFATKNNILDWQIEKVVYLGYYKSNPNKKYYSLEGYFTCQDGTNSCVYQEQTSDDEESGKYSYNGTLIIEDDNIGISGLFIVAEADNFVLINEEIK